MTDIQMYSHDAVIVAHEEGATGKEMRFYKCVDCGVRCLMDDPEKMEHIGCEAYQRGNRP
jgi:hypothetical protein